MTADRPDITTLTLDDRIAHIFHFFLVISDHHETEQNIKAVLAEYAAAHAIEVLEGLKATLDQAADGTSLQSPDGRGAAMALAFVNDEIDDLIDKMKRQGG